MTFGSGVGGASGSVALGVAIIAGVSAGGFVILLAIIACCACVITRARQGERAAVWVLENVLCSKVNEELAENQRPDIKSRAIDARRSLERAVHDEHERLRDVVWCAHCLQFFCPRFIKFKERPIPNEEDLLREAMYQEEDMIAQRHKPTSVPPPKTAVDKSEVEEAIPEDDEIWDWEKHIDPTTNRAFFYNAKTGKSQWTPPAVKVHQSKDRSSQKMDPTVFTPKPPTEPRPKDAFDAADENRVKQQQ